MSHRKKSATPQTATTAPITCGALIGGTIVLDYFFGRSAEEMSHTDQARANVASLQDAVGIAGILFDKFVTEHGTIIWNYRTLACILF